MQKLQPILLIGLFLLVGCEKEPTPTHPLNRQELLEMIKAGRDVTQVDVSEIKDMSSLFLINEDLTKISLGGT